MKEPAHLFRERQGFLILIAIALVAAFLCVRGLSQNPPGFYIDESSVSYNAYTIAQNGCDEFGVSWPLYFRAFGDYKNPLYIYILAGLFRLTGPSIFVARSLSAVAIILSAIILGLLAKRITRSRSVALLIVTFALITPWLFETSRVAMEVALYPACLSLFLLCLYRASAKSVWSYADIGSLSSTLALLTYTYSIGRVLAPLLAGGLALFWTRPRWRGIVATWCAFAITLTPIFIFSYRHPGALSDRFKIITYLKPDVGYGEAVLEFGKHYLSNLNPWTLLVTGDPNPDQIAHIFHTGHFLAAIFAFSGVGAWLVVRLGGKEKWWRFILYAFAISLVPASLTNDRFHMLRLIAMPVFLLVLAMPALAWFMARIGTRPWREIVIFLLALTGIQAVWFQWEFHQSSHTAMRLHLFDAAYRQTIFQPAVALNMNPIYLADALSIPGYIQAYWNATLERVDLSRFVRLLPAEPPPSGALVISTEENCPSCQVLARSSPYILYVAKESPRSIR